MPIYNSSSKGQIDTTDMATPHLERALAKAEREGNAENVKALTEELLLRSSEQSSDAPMN